MSAPRKAMRGWILAARPFLLVCFGLAGPAAAGAEFGQTAFEGYSEFRSAYYSRGKIINSEPILPLFGQGLFSLGPVGYLGASAFNVNAVSDGGQSADRRNAFNESDLKAYYGYDWNFGGGWALANTVGRQWVLYPGYHNGKPTRNEWQVGQGLRNPYVTPYYLMRWAFRGEKWTAWRVGLTRSFSFGHGLVLKPNVWCDFGDQRLFDVQYGEACSDGLMALNGELRLEWWFVRHFGTYVSVQQFGVVSHSGRASLQASSAPQSVTDLTIFTVGLAARF